MTAELKAIMLAGDLYQIQAAVEQRNHLVDLSHSRVTDEEVALITKNIMQYPGIETLDLSHNEINDEGAFSCFWLINQVGLVHLNLSHNNLTDVGAQKILNGAFNPTVFNTELLSFDISGNKISAEMEVRLMNSWENLKARNIALSN